MADKTPAKPAPIEPATRYFTAAGSDAPSEEENASVAKITAAVVYLATAIGENTPEGRNQALALTALEDVHMRANRAIFAPEGAK